MAVTSTDSARAARPRAMPQFGLQAMLGMTAVIAVVCSLFFSIPPPVATPVMLGCVTIMPSTFTPEDEAKLEAALQSIMEDETNRGDSDE